MTEMDGQRRAALAQSAAAIIPTMLAFGLMISGACASELPCPPRHYFCWEVKAAVSTWGEQAVRAQARKCGWSEARIGQAEKCLNGK